MTATGAWLAGHAVRLAAQADRVALCLDFDGASGLDPPKRTCGMTRLRWSESPSRHLGTAPIR
jgi:hypothetical protein